MNETTKDYRVTIKVRNARIINALAEKGEVVGVKAAEKIGITYAKLLALSNLKLSPIDKGGNIISEVHKLCEFTNKLPFDLFSVDQIVPLEKNTAEIEMAIEEVRALIEAPEMSPDELLINKQFSDEVIKVLETLTEKEDRVIRLHWGIGCEPHTLAEIAKIFGLSKTSIDYIKARALRKLKHPSRSNQLQAIALDMPMPEIGEESAKTWKSLRNHAHTLE